MKLGDRVSGVIKGQPFTGTVKNVNHRGGYVERDGSLVGGTVTGVRILTDQPLTTPAGRIVHTAVVRGAAELSGLTPLPPSAYGCPPHPAIVLRDGGAYCTECGARVG